MIKINNAQKSVTKASSRNRSMSLEEGTPKLRADLVALLLLLCEVLLQLVCGETHFGLASFVQGAMGSQPGALQTLCCCRSPPAGHTRHYTMSTFSMLPDVSGPFMNSKNKKLDKIITIFKWSACIFSSFYCNFVELFSKNKKPQI